MSDTKRSSGINPITSGRPTDEAEANNPKMAGKLASSKVTFGDGRYTVAAVHTRFDALSWFVWDSEKQDEVLTWLEGDLDSDKKFSSDGIIRQAPTMEEAVAGLEATGDFTYHGNDCDDKDCARCAEGDE